MVKVIGQETFNEAVLENMNMLELSVDEAIRETVEQFNSQGVNLSNIIKEKWCVLGEEDPLVVALERITVSSDVDMQHLDTIIEFCGKDLSFKLKAAELGAYIKVLEILKNNKEEEVMCKSLDALCSLMDGYPDLLEADGFSLIFELTANDNRGEILRRTLEWTRLCCIRHENNRKTFIDRSINDVLNQLLIRKKDESKIIWGVCKLVITLTLDDDIRDTVSNSHMHACILASSLLPTLVPLLHTEDVETVSHVLNTIASVLVRDTLCQQFVDLGGLEKLFNVLSDNSSSKILTRGFNVLGCLAGHDQIKDSIIKAGLAPRIAESLTTRKDSLPFCRSVLSLVARLSLRSPTNSKALYDAGLGNSIVQIMKVYPSDKKVQSLSCLAIRNMASRNPDLRPKFLALDLEPLLRQISKTFPELSDNAKSALLALDVNVKLKEEWTGKHGDIVKANQ